MQTNKQILKKRKETKHQEKLTLSRETYTCFICGDRFYVYMGRFRST